MLESRELDEGLQGRHAQTENEHIIYAIAGPSDNVQCEKEPEYHRNK